MHDPIFFTPSGVRLRRRVERPGDLHWLLLPGGPGIGSESLHALADALDVPGCVWMVDLPGDGSNVSPPGAGDDPFARWPNVLVEAAEALPNVVYVGHSTGGMYLLATPELEGRIVGLALVSSAPDAGWRAPFAEMTQRCPLPEVDAAAARYEAERTRERLADLVVASVPWNFTPSGVDAGRELLARMPYNPAAVKWSEENFDETYVARWRPQGSMPVLILGGEEDRIVTQRLWDRAEWAGENVVRRSVPGAAHFVWMEAPGAVREAFADLAKRVVAGR